MQILRTDGQAEISDAPAGEALDFRNVNVRYTDKAGASGVSKVDVMLGCKSELPPVLQSGH